MMKNETTPSLEGDLVSVLDIDTLHWSRLSIHKKTSMRPGPGPRVGHTMFVYKRALYVWGGKTSALELKSDSKLYKLDLRTIIDDHDNNTNTTTVLSWEVIKTKRSSPPGREEYAGVLYQGYYYIHGGYQWGQGVINDLWCLNMSNLKWSKLPVSATKFVVE